MTSVAAHQIYPEMKLGSFTFNSDGVTVTIRGLGREARLPTHWFLRSVFRILWFDFMIGQFEFYGGFGTTNDDTHVYLLMLGKPKLAEKVTREEARDFFKRVYDAYRTPGYRELT